MTKITHKQCSKCNETKPLDMFQVARKCVGGKRPECKACMKEINKAWRAKNLETHTAKKKEYYQNNKERIHEQHREYIARNKDAVFKRHQNYREKNKDKIRAWHAATPRGALNKSLKLALKRRPTENPATVDELMAMWRAQDGKCIISGLVMTWFSGKTTPTSISMDRIDGACGYSIDNIRLICYQANCFRNRWTDDQMLTMARAIVAKADAADPDWNSAPGYLAESDHLKLN